MKRVANINLPDPWKLVALEPGDNSPMQGHAGGEVAVDTQSHTFYVQETFLITYGTDSVVRACNKYLARPVIVHHSH